MLAMGYETCGVMALKKHPDVKVPLQFFYAGNFFWATCTHINRLPSIASLNHSNRYEAEGWLGMAAQNISVSEYMGNTLFTSRR